MKGQRYPIIARSVNQLCNLLEDKCGIKSEDQKVLHEGRVLQKNDFLEEIGLINGDIVQVKDNTEIEMPSIEIDKKKFEEMMKELQKKDPIELLEEFLTPLEKVLNDPIELVFCHFLIVFMFSLGKFSKKYASTDG